MKRHPEMPIKPMIRTTSITKHSSAYLQEILLVADCICIDEQIIQKSASITFIYGFCYCFTKRPDPNSIRKVLNRNSTAFAVKQDQILSHS